MSVSVSKAGAGAGRKAIVRTAPWLLLFALSLPAVTSRIYAADEVEYFSFLRSLWFDRDVSFENEYSYFYNSGSTRTPLFHETFLEAHSATGLRENFGTVGSALLWAPFYAVADAGVHLARLTGARVRADGYSRPYVAAVAYGSAVYGFLALMLAAHAWRSLAPRGEQAPAAGARTEILSSDNISVAAVWLGTPLLFYMYVAPPFSHATSAFAVAAFIVVWLRVRSRWSPAGLVALGALAALMTMVREQDAFIAGGAAVDFAWSVAASLRERRLQDATKLALSGLAGCVAGAVAFLPQAFSYLALNGRIGPSPMVSRKMEWSSPHAWSVLVSPEHGFLFWTPLAALAIAGLVALALGKRGRDVRRIAICLLAMLVLQVYVAGCVASWTVAGAFGQRRFVCLTAVLVIGLAALIASARARAARRAVLAAAIVSVWWNVALMVQFGTGLMDRQRLTLAANAYNAFVVVPRELPRIVYRYAFDRTSFYAAPGTQR